MYQLTIGYSRSLMVAWCVSPLTFSTVTAQRHPPNWPRSWVNTALQLELKLNLITCIKRVFFVPLLAQNDTCNGTFWPLKASLTINETKQSWQLDILGLGCFKGRAATLITILTMVRIRILFICQEACTRNLVCHRKHNINTTQHSVC